MNDNRKKFKRRHYLVKKDYQIKFMLKFCLLLLLGVIVSTGMLILFTKGTLTTSFHASRLTIEDTAFVILPSVLLTNLITLGLVSLAAVIVILFVTHKVVGPMIRFEKDINQIGQGDLTKVIRLRNKDQLTATAENLNKMTKSLRQKVLDIREDLTGITEAISSSEVEVPGRLIPDLNALQQKVETYFKV